MIKRIFSCTIALILSLLSACAGNQPSVPSDDVVRSDAPASESVDSAVSASSETPDEEPTATSQATQTPTHTPKPTPEPTATPMPSLPNRLTCLDDAIVEDIIYAGSDYLVALCRNTVFQHEDEYANEDAYEDDEVENEEPDSEEESDPEDGFELRRVNISSNTIEASYKGSGSHSLIGVRANGEIITHSTIDGKISIFDKGLKLDHIEETVGALNVFMDPVNDRLIYQPYSSGNVHARDFDGNDIVIVSTRLNLTDVDPQSGNLLFTKSNSYNEGFYVIYQPEGELADGPYSGQFELRNCFLAGENYLLLPWESSESKNEFVPLAVVSRKTGETKNRYSIKTKYSAQLYTSSRTSYALIAEHYWDDGELKTSTGIFDSNSGRICYFENLFDSGWLINSAKYAEDIDRWIVVSTGENEDHYRISKTLLINPQLVDYSDTLPAWSGKDAKPTLPDFLLTARSKADRIEKKYGVRILLANELIAMPEDANAFTSSTAKKYLDDALNTLSAQLAIYPQGFFDEFKDIFGIGGVEFRLFADIAGLAGDTNTAGLNYTIRLNTKTMGAWTIHHEFWHVVEGYISKQSDYTFAYDDWQALNPEDFDYIGDRYDTDYELYGTYLYERDTTEPFFIRAYSLKNTLEDRATLVEEMLKNATYDNMEKLYSYPNLKAKYDFMAERVEAVFGYVYWEKMCSNSD